MNIFYLSYNPKFCAQEHCDKHVVKMIVEYAQLLSTAHRVIDGFAYNDTSVNGRKVKRFKLDEPRESNLYKACHINHPSAVWARSSTSHYKWLYELFEQCCIEYTRRYGKYHATESLKSYLRNPPRNLPPLGWTDPPPAMPDKYKVQGDSIQSYRNYYIGEKVSFAKWKSPSVEPQWYSTAINNYANLSC
jgi:hypothetical protein